jgi:hypothetical protein
MAMHTCIGEAKTGESQQTKNELPQTPEHPSEEDGAKTPPRNKVKTPIVYFALILAIFVSGSLIGNHIGYGNGYQSGYREGENAGIEEGNVIGYEVGYNFGDSHGYNKGYSEGNSAGYQLGYDLGQKVGYTSGFKVGNGTGYIEGFNDSWQSGFQEAGYHIRDPTYQEVLDFVEADQTDKILYDLKSFNCFDFSAAVKKNAFDLGYRAFFVYIEFKVTSHSVVAFNTTDEGIVFVEPQHDKVLSLEVGENYTSLNGFLYDPDLVIVRYILMV